MSHWLLAHNGWFLGLYGLLEVLGGWLAGL